jgi:hypothetical protein
MLKNGCIDPLTRESPWRGPSHAPPCTGSECCLYQEAVTLSAAAGLRAVESNGPDNAVPTIIEYRTPRALQVGAMGRALAMGPRLALISRTIIGRFARNALSPSRPRAYHHKGTILGNHTPESRHDHRGLP